MIVEPAAFDYERKRWGEAPVLPRPWSLPGLKLRYCLDDLRSVGGSCLDVGCGAGAIAKAIKRERPDLSVCGVDVSRSAIARARADPQGVDFRISTATRLPFADASFDAVTIFDVLEHLEQPETVLKEIARVLRPGGLFHIALPLEGQRGTIYPFLAWLGWDGKRRHSGHIQAFDRAGFRRMAGSVGLPVQRVRWSFHPLFALIDVLYYCWLDLRGPVGHSVEDMVADHPDQPALRRLKGIIASIGWYESRLLRRLPGACGHFTCIRLA